MTIVYKPEPGSKGSYLQARREALALVHALEDPATFAAVLRDQPEAATGLLEPHSVEVGLVVERVDGALVITAFERSALLEA
ncbi:MAG: hypothetical protein WA161_24720 [Pseudomonas sp.]|uniref:hypothetical protein n=1 Tax=Pseudomonas sp. TaxID=306 RepID=UPI003BB6CC1A